MRRGRRCFGLVLLGAVLCGASACRAKGDLALPGKTKLPIVVRASEDSNEGRPVYVVVRAIDEKRFVEDSYAEVAALVIEPDETVIATLLVFPGKNALQELELDELPAVIGVYCLFAETQDDAWKLMLEGVNVVDVSVGLGTVVSEGGQ